MPEGRAVDAATGTFAVDHLRVWKIHFQFAFCSWVSP